MSWSWLCLDPAFLGLLLTMTFFLCCLELLHSAENKHEFILHKMMVFTFMFWIRTGLLKTMVFCKKKLKNKTKKKNSLAKSRKLRR